MRIAVPPTICMNFIAFITALVPRTSTFRTMHPITFVLTVIYKAASVVESRKALSGTTEFSPTLVGIKRRVFCAVAQISGTQISLPLLKTCG